MNIKRAFILQVFLHLLSMFSCTFFLKFLLIAQKSANKNALKIDVLSPPWTLDWWTVGKMSLHTSDCFTHPANVELVAALTQIRLSLYF